MNALRRLPKPTTPSGVEDWVNLAVRVREQRAMADLWSGFKTIVSGHVIHTTLTPDDISHKVVHTYDDGPTETARMYAGTLHPASQAAPCVCSSGGRYVDCCLAQIADDPCPCGSGVPFRNCCSVDSRAVTRLGVLAQ